MELEWPMVKGVKTGGVKGGERQLKSGGKGKLKRSLCTQSIGAAKTVN